MKKVLVLGGTRFLGRVFLEELIKKGNDYDITLFNRGTTNADLFPELRRIKGDRRTDDIQQLGKENWDIVIDFSSYYPLPLERLMDVLKDKVGRYIYISTGSVYDLEKTVNTILTENSTLVTYTEEDKVGTTAQTYGKRKKACEDVLLKYKWLDTIILRPGVVYGRYDYTDRHYYWIYRLQHEKQALLPENGKARMSFTFVDDLARIIMQSMEIEKHNIIYNTVTHPIISLKTLVQTTAAALQKEVELIPVSAEWLEAQEIKQYYDIFYWTTDDLLMKDNHKILQDYGITFTPLEESLKQTAAYYEQLGWPVCKVGLSLEKERELIGRLGQQGV